MEFTLALVFGFGIFAVVMAISKQQKKKIHTQFELMAERLGLQLSIQDLDFFSSLFKEAYPELTGNLNERYPVRIFMFTRGSGKHRKTFIAFELTCNNPQKHNLTLMIEGFFRKIGKAIGMQEDIQIRDDEFDNQFIIKSNNHLFAKQILADPDLREEFLQNHRAFLSGTLKLDKNVIHYEAQATLSTPQVASQLEQMLKLSLLLAHRLEEMREGPTFEMN